MTIVTQFVVTVQYVSRAVNFWNTIELVFRKMASHREMSQKIVTNDFDPNHNDTKMERKLPLKEEDTNVFNVERKAPTKEENQLLGRGEPVGDPLLDATVIHDTDVQTIVHQLEKHTVMEHKLPLKVEDTNVSCVERKTPVKNPVIEKPQGDPLLDAALMRDTDVHTIVREAYASRVTGKTCGTTCCSKVLPSPNIERAAEKMGYTKEEADEPGNLGLGCGAPLKAAAIKEGDTVLDLGSGAGFDAFLAARVVGPTGLVIGVDLTPEMVDKAKANAAKHHRENVDFRLGKIEALPVESNSVDCVISNCVINLSPDKPAIFREAYRVLKSGGRVAFSDICITRPLPESVKTNMAAYVGCIAGASVLDEYLGAMRAAGFLGVEAKVRHAFDVLACDDPIVLAALHGMEEDELDNVRDTIVSATVVAYKA